MTVILDRRDGPDRRKRAASPGGKRELRDRRRPRIPGTFLETEAERIESRAVAILGAKTFQNYIAGEWVDAASGETFESTSPANGDAIGVFPRSSAEDVDRAVAAAKERLRGLAPRPGAEARRDPLPLRAPPGRAEGGPRPADGPRDGQGAARGARRRPGSDRHGLLHGRRGPAPVRPDDPVRAPRQVQHERPPADRGRRRDHAVELPDRDPELEDAARARLRQHGRLQAGHRHADARRALRRAADRSRRPRRRRQHRPRGRGTGRRCARPAPGRAGHLAHRLARDRRRGHEDRRRPPQAHPPRARRQERDHRHGRCRSRPGRRGHRLVGVRNLRPALHRGEPRDRARGRLRRARVAARRGGRAAAARRRLGGGHRRRAGDQPGRAREDRLVHRDRP